MEESTFLEKFGAIIIALVALVQPWLIHLWRNYVKAGRVDFFETGNLEIGFSGFASTIGINGTLRSINQDFFIASINLVLTKEKDSSKHNFEWAVFRDTKLSLSGNKDVDVELPYGLMLMTQSPQRVNIQFHDRKQQEDIRPIYNKLSFEWQKFLNQELPFEQRRLTSDLENKTYTIYEHFSKSMHATEAFTEITREFYWDKGNYSLELIVQTSKPDKLFKKRFMFVLTEEECENLRLNVFPLIDLACEQSRYTWNFVNTNYK